jgi:Zn-dependent M28 family amino/carboxypeptidase
MGGKMLNAHKIIKEINFERLAGSKEETRATEILTKYFIDMGLEPRLETFKLTSFETGMANIICKGKSFPAHPFGLNKNAEVEGELVYLDNPDVINYNLGAYKNKIIISSRYSRQLSLDAKKAGIAGFIRIGSPLREAPSSSHRQKNFKEGYIDSVTVKHNHGEKLIKLVGNKAKINIKQKVGQKTANNIVCDIKGKGRDENLIVVGAHYDSVARSPGASDNGGGTATVIKVAEFFCKHTPQRDLRLVLFSGEELGLLGSQAFVQKHEQELKKRCQFMLNVDVAGDAVGFDVAKVIGTKQLAGYFTGISKEIGLAFYTDLDIYSSDSMPFSKYEIPSVNILRHGGKGSYYIHTPQDSVNQITRKGMASTVKATINFLQHVVNAEIFPIQKKIDSSLREKIEKYLWNLNFEEPKLEWKPKYKR